MKNNISEIGIITNIRIYLIALKKGIMIAGLFWLYCTLYLIIGKCLNFVTLNSFKDVADGIYISSIIMGIFFKIKCNKINKVLRRKHIYRQIAFGILALLFVSLSTLVTVVEGILFKTTFTGADCLYFVFIYIARFLFGMLIGYIYELLCRKPETSKKCFN